MSWWKSARPALISACLVIVACSGPASESPPSTQSRRAAIDERYRALEHEYVTFVLAHYPVIATYLGGATFDKSLAEIDGKLRDYSPEAVVDEDRQLESFRARLQALDDSELSPRARVDRKVALAQIEFMLHQHGVRRYQDRSLDTYLDEPFRGVDWQIQGMTSTGPDHYGTDAEWDQVVNRVRAVKRYLATAERQLRIGADAGSAPDWRVLRQIGLSATLADAEYFSKTLPEIARTDIVAPQSDAVVDSLKQAGAEAAEAYRHLRDFLIATYFEDLTRTGSRALKPQFRADRFAMGEAEYNWALHNNLRIDQTVTQLYEASLPIVEATAAQMQTLAKEIAASHHWSIGGGDDSIVKRVFSHLGEDAPANDAEMLEWYRKVGERLVQYARDTSLFDVPADYRLEVTLAPPPLWAALDGASYFPAPAFKTTGVGRFYVPPTHDDRTRLKLENNRSRIAYLAAHEGFPGHDWHFKVMTRNRETISPVRWLTPGAVEDSSSMWEDSMAAEGWALYAEGLMAEPQPKAPHGFYTPEERLYQLRGKLYRDLRVRLDTGLHTGRISFAEAVNQFSTIVDFLPGNCDDQKALADPVKRASCAGATSAINRYALSPTQAVTYRLGRDEIMAARETAKAALGERFSAQRFHIEFMKQGTVPAGYFADELEASLARAR